MKKTAAISILVLALTSRALMAQTTSSYSSVLSDFDEFASDVSSSLPFASTDGLNWSSAYVGGFPHLGIGVSAGFASVPLGGLEAVANTFGMSALTSQLGQYSHIGLPLPSAVVEARLGGFIIPFDVGVKVGYIPQQLDLDSFLPDGMSVNYLMWGVDARLQLVKQGFFLPEISIGAAYDHYEGGLTVPTGSGSISVQNLGGSGENITVSDPTLNFFWESNDVDFDVEVSKTLLYFVTPYIGAGITYGWSTAGGGLSSTAQITGASNYSQYFSSSTPTSFSLSESSANWSGRIFGGASLNLVFLKIDVTGMYDLTTQLIGASVGTRLQF